MGDKKQFVDELSQVFAKWGLFDILKLEYCETPYDEIVDITYKGGYTKSIRVTWDSCSAILKDVLKHIEGDE